MRLSRTDVFVLLSVINFFFITFIFYTISKLNNGVGTAPLFISGDDGLMYHRVATGEQSLEFDLIWVNIVRSLYHITVEDPLVIRFFLFSVFSFNLIYIVLFNSKNPVEIQTSRNSGIKLLVILLCFSPSFYFFYFLSIYRDILIAACFFFSSIFLYRRYLILSIVFLFFLFLLRPYMAGAVLLSFAIVSVIGVNNGFKLFFILFSIFAIIVSLITPISSLFGLNLVDFRGSFAHAGANSTFGINFDGSVIKNIISYIFSIILNFCSGLPLFYDRSEYIIFFILQSLPVVIIYYLVFFNKVAHSNLERQLLISFLVWVMTYSIMNDNAGNSLRLFSVGLPVLLFVSTRLYLYSGLKSD